MSQADRCELCERQASRLTRHHLIPKSQHKRKSILRMFSKEQMLGDIALLCKPCHKFIHSVLSEKQLAQDYFSVELLKMNPEVIRFIEWIKTKLDGFHSRTRKKKK